MVVKKKGKTLVTLLLLVLAACSSFQPLDSLGLPSSDYNQVVSVLKQNLEFVSVLKLDLEFKVATAKWLDPNSIEVVAWAGTEENGAKKVMQLQKNAGVWELKHEYVQFFDHAGK